MKTVAIYARYSTDLQSDASIEDQIRICKERARANGWHVVNCYTDHAVSGASMMRPGIQIMMQDAQAGKFDLVLAEALDRLSRDQEDIAGIYKRLQFAGVAIETIGEGPISNLHIGLKGTMNAMFLSDLADKTRRGLRGRVEQGKSGGGVTYGYDVVRKIGEDGEATTGERTINPEQAEIVRRIFREYAKGKSPRAIAIDLNNEGVKGPSGKGWGPTTINGNRQRGTGVLNNELYIGRLVWNRLRYIKDPETGKRVSRPNPEAEWIIQDVHDLRIVDQDLWDAVKERQGAIVRNAPALCDRPRPKSLFSKLIKCGHCGGSYTIISRTHLGCFNTRNKGTCDNRRGIGREALEEAVLGAVREYLKDDELCKVFCEEYATRANELRQEHNASLAQYEREREKLARHKAKLIDCIKEGIDPKTIASDLNQTHARIEELDKILASVEEAPVLLHPNMAQRYHQEIRRLIDCLNEPEHRAEAVEIVRSLVDKIVVTFDQDEQRLVVDLHGDLAGILSVATGRGLPPASGGRVSPTNKLAAGRGGKGVRDQLELEQIVMVAGRGFEPLTFRL